MKSNKIRFLKNKTKNEEGLYVTLKSAPALTMLVIVNSKNSKSSSQQNTSFHFLKVLVHLKKILTSLL